MKNIPDIPSPRLEVRDLRLLLALASAGSTAEASSLLHLTQPAVSRALLALEEKLGARLFERGPRGLTISDAGKRLLPTAGQLLAALVELEQLVLRPSAVTRLRIVCECYTAYHWLPSALARLRSSQPVLEVSLAIEHTAAPVAALEAGEIDAALLTTARVSRGIEERPLFSDEVVFVLSPDHPLAKKRALTPDDLQQVVLLSSNAPVEETRWFMRSVFGKARPKLRFERVPLTEALLDLARAGMGVVVLSEWMAAPHLGQGDLVTRRLHKGPLRRPWRLAWRREIGDAGPRLLAALAASAPRARLVG